MNGLIYRSKQMNRRLLLPEVQQYLRANLDQQPSDIALSKSTFDGIAPKELAEQLDSMKRSAFKLPTWFNTEKIYYPPRIAIEQSSSEITAYYKSKFFIGLRKVVDLTGGFGVDSHHFSKVVREVIYCEINPDLAAIVDHNSLTLQSKNLSIFVGDGLSYLRALRPAKNTISIDAIYIDPARRHGYSKVYKLEESYPNIVELHHELLSISSHLMIKASPMLDIDAALTQLNFVKQVHIISVDDECKELLFLLARHYKGHVDIKAVALNSTTKTEKSLQFRREEESNAVISYSLPLTYLYAPDAALLKAGAFKIIALQFNFDKIHPNTHLYTGNHLETAFPGKILEVERVETYMSFKKRKQSVAPAIVVSKNFPIAAADLRKRHQIPEGKDQHMYFCKDNTGSLIVIHCRVIRLSHLPHPIQPVS